MAGLAVPLRVEVFPVGVVGPVFHRVAFGRSVRPVLREPIQLQKMNDSFKLIYRIFLLQRRIKYIVPFMRHGI